MTGNLEMRIFEFPASQAIGIINASIDVKF